MSFVRKFSFFLLPSVFQGIIAIGILPIMTRILGPEEYGIFALLTSLGALGAVLASSGVTFVMAAHYPIIEHNERQKLVSSVLAFGITISALFCIVVVLFWPLIAQTFVAFKEIPSSAVYLSLVAMLLGIPWTLSLDVITLNGRAKLFASVLLLQSVTNAATAIVSLYVFKAGLYSLFIAGVAGSIVLFIGALVASWKYLVFASSFKWMMVILKTGFSTVAASLLETVYALVERSMLSLYVGMSKLGIFTHSQQYRTMGMMIANAAARTIWPITLAESRLTEINFSETKRTWDAIYVMLTLAGIVFAAVGQYVISILTNNKFSDAYTYVVFWIIYLLVQNSGKAHTGVLFVLNKGASYAFMQIEALVVGGVLLFLLVPFYGVTGAITALFIHMILFRVLIQLKVRGLKNVSFQDGWVLIGSFLILSTFLISWGLKLSFAYNMVLLSIMTILLALFARHIVKNVIVIIKKNLI